MKALSLSIFLTVCFAFCPGFAGEKCQVIFSKPSAYEIINQELGMLKMPLVPQHRFNEIVAKVERLHKDKIFSQIRFQENQDNPGLATAYQISPRRFLVETNHKNLNHLSKSAQNLVMMHELGHTRLGHHEMLRETPENWVQYEVEADIFAALAYRKFYYRTQGLNEFLDFVTTNKDTLPPGPFRAKVFRLLLDFQPAD